MSSRIEKKASARERAAQLRAQQLRAERRRRVAYAGGAVVLVVVLVAALVIARLSGAGSGTTKPSGEASAKLLAAINGVPASALDSVGAGSASGGPKSVNTPDLADNGKPKVLYIGAEYCPYCAAERWAVAVALARFGKFTALGTTHSSSSDVDPNTPTLSFHKAAYSSSVLSFTGVETTTNKATAGGYQKLDSPSASDQKVFDTYNKPPYVSGSGGAIPFVDIGGKYISSGATYDPGLLAGMTQQQVADAMKDPTSAIGKAILGSANLFTAAICGATADQPSNVCSSTGVKAAAAKLGKS